MKLDAGISNYEKICEQWRQRFLKMDPNLLKTRLPELTDEGDWMTLSHFARRFSVNKLDGRIVAPTDSDPVYCYEKLNIYTLFGFVSPLAQFKDRWVKFNQLKGAAPFSRAFHTGVTLPFAKTFNGHMIQLEQAMKSLHGRRLTQSDAGYELDAFACLPVRFLFWDGDDEFQAQANLLFDASATDYIHVESIVTIAAIGLDRLAKQAGLPLDRSCFPIF